MGVALTNAIDAEPMPAGARVEIRALARSLSTAAIVGSLGGLVIGGVLGRLAMRLLAVTSPDSAQGGFTDDEATVGEITMRGTIELATTTTAAGVLGGLIYLLVRRVLPNSIRARVLGYGLFTGAVGGALFLHEHGSFDYTVLAPAWLAVAIFIVPPLLFGLLVAALVEVTDRDARFSRRVPLVMLVVIALVLSWPAIILANVFVIVLIVTTVFIGLAIAVILVPILRKAWHSRAITVAGGVLYSFLVLWGLYGIVADVVSIATDRPWPLPLNP